MSYLQERNSQAALQREENWHGATAHPPVQTGVTTVASPFNLMPEVAWLLVLVLIPLFVNFWSFQPFDHAKSLLFTGLVWSCTGWIAAQAAWQSRGLSSLQIGPLHLAALLWLVVLGFATLWAVVPGLSLFGSDLRGQGLVTQFSYVLLFFLLAWGIRNMAQIDRLYSAVIFATAPLLLLGFVQQMGLDPFGLVTDARSPAYTTLGRANFTGAYLALVLPLTLNRILPAQQGRVRAALIGIMAAQVLLLLLTGSRSAWIAGITGVLILGAFQLWPRFNRLGRLALWMGGSVGASVATYGIGRTFVTATEGSLAARITIWRATLDLIRARPWTGYGLDNLEVVFPWVFPPQLVYYQGRDVYVDRAHNLLLDWTVAAGIPALLALLLLLGAFFYTAVRNWTQATDRPAARLHQTTGIAVIMAALTGNLASFDVTATAVLTWAIMGITASRPLAPPAEPAHLHLPSWFNRTGSPVLPGSPVLRGALTLLISAGVILAITHSVLRPTLAGIAHRAAHIAAAQNDAPTANRQAERAQWLWPHSVEHRWLNGQVHQMLARQAAPDAQREHLHAAEGAYLAAVEQRPTDALTWKALADFYAAWPQHASLPTALAAYEQALALAPNSATLWVAVARAALQHGEADQALHALHAAVDLDATYTQAYQLMGDLYHFHYLNQDAADWAYAEALRWQAR